MREVVRSVEALSFQEVFDATMVQRNRSAQRGL